jgi:hypothetical protein
MPDPTFFLIGGQKCGTTWMARLLGQHPDVFVPDRKELHFFDRAVEGRRDMTWYRDQFADGESCRAVGECTPNYLGIVDVPPYAISRAASLGIQFADHPEAASHIASDVAGHYPDARLVVMLRDPVERAISSYHHQIAMRRISPRTPFHAAAGRLGIVSMGFFGYHLRSWLAHFAAEQILVVIGEEDLGDRAGATVAAVYRHLGVDDRFVPEGLDRRVGERASPAALFLRYYAPRTSRRLLRLVPAVARLPLPTPEVTDADRRDLRVLYEPDVALLEEQLGRSLRCWSPRSAAPATRV